MRINPEISGINIVLVGSFNPSILTPAWFELHGLLPPGTGETATLHVAHRQVATFEADWLLLDVNANQFIASTTQEPFIRVRDLVVRVFAEQLSHTPINAMGINRDVHFKVRNAAERMNIGRALAPLDPWGQLGRDLELDNERAGMTSLTMSQYPGGAATSGGQLNITVEPSRRIADKSLGVYVRVNDHFGVEDTSAGRETHFMELLANNFDASHRRSDEIIDHVMSLASTTES